MIDFILLSDEELVSRIVFLISESRNAGHYWLINRYPDCRAGLFPSGWVKISKTPVTRTNTASGRRFMVWRNANHPFSGLLPLEQNTR